MIFKIISLLLVLAVVCYGAPYAVETEFGLDGNGHSEEKAVGQFLQGGLVSDPGFSDSQGRGGIPHDNGSSHDGHGHDNHGHDGNEHDGHRHDVHGHDGNGHDSHGHGGRDYDPHSLEY